MEIKKKIIDVFGTNALEHALFYKHHAALRFELSKGGSFVDQFICAFNKASEVVNATSGNSSDVFVCISFYCEGGFLSALSVFRGIYEMGMTIPSSCEAWSEKDDSYPELNRVKIVFQTKPSDFGLII